MSDHPSAAAAREALEAFVRGDVEGLAAAALRPQVQVMHIREGQLAEL